jgi:hypothetical protein
MVGVLERKSKKQSNKLFVETFHWAWSHNILQIKGNRDSYQKKGLHNDEKKIEVDHTKNKYSSSNYPLCKMKKNNT